MTQPVKNLRVKRTQKLLREALIELIEERGFDPLTVSEVTARALVSRAAFYRNYRDKYDLVEQIFDEAMSALFMAVADMGPEHPPQIWVRFFEHIAEYDRLYRALLGRQGSPWFVIKMRAAMADLVKEHGRLPNWQPAGDPLAHPFPDEFVPDLVATLLVEAVTWWLEQIKPYLQGDCDALCPACFCDLQGNEYLAVRTLPWRYPPTGVIAKERSD